MPDAPPSLRATVVAVLAVLLGAAVASLATAASAQRSAVHKVHRHHHRARRGARARTVSPRAARGLQFGVYPWASPGAANQVDPQLLDNRAKALAAVKTLQGDRSLTVRLYGQYTGTSSADADALVNDARWWSEKGVRVQMVLRYRPASPDLASGYVPWIQTVTARLAALPRVVSIQIGNEANNSSSLASSDGAYPGAIDAIAQGVPAARQAVIAGDRPDIEIGINWAAGNSPCAPDPFWSQLRAAGGSAFVSAVGWVGIDIYPGTWSPPSASTYPSASLIEASLNDSLSCLRTEHMAAAGLSDAVAISLTETGYPTDPARSEATQAAVLKEITASVESLRRAYGVTGLMWFDLRDANTASGQLENGYGLLHDDYSPKPAFAAYQQIIAAEGG